LWASLPEEIQKQILEQSVSYYIPGLSLVCKAWFLLIHCAGDFSSDSCNKQSYSVCDVRSTVEDALNAQKEPLSRQEEEAYVLAWLAYKHGMVDEAAKLMQKPTVLILVLQLLP
jgi:hypothetical protein